MDPRLVESIYYRGSYGSKAVLSPLGYGRIEKVVRRGCGVHSARTQFLIHSVAAGFESDLLFIPRVYSCGAQSYVMDHVPLIARLRPEDYKASEDFFKELVRFYLYMFHHGYYPYGFTIGILEDGRYLLFDFSLFGHVQGRLVKFKFSRTPLDIELVEKLYGIMYFMDLFEQHLIRVVFDPDEVISTPLLAIEDTRVYNNRPPSRSGNARSALESHQDSQVGEPREYIIPLNNYEEEHSPTSELPHGPDFVGLPMDSEEECLSDNAQLDYMALNAHFLSDS
jgi:hypothetical protein